MMTDSALECSSGSEPNDTIDLNDFQLPSTPVRHANTSFVSVQHSSPVTIQHMHEYCRPIVAQHITEHGTRHTQPNSSPTISVSVGQHTRLAVNQPKPTSSSVGGRVILSGTPENVASHSSTAFASGNSPLSYGAVASGSQMSDDVAAYDVATINSGSNDGRFMTTSVSRTSADNYSTVQPGHR